MKAKLRGNQCTECKKTHEICRYTNCPKAGISDHVCVVFGILRRPQKSK